MGRDPNMMRRSLNTGFLLILLGLLAFVSFLLIRPFLDYIVIGLLLTFVFYPLYERILRRVRWKGLASILTIVLITLIVVLPIFFAAWSLVRDVSELATEYSVDDFVAFLHRIDEAFARLTGFAGPTDGATEPPPEPPPDGGDGDSGSPDDTGGTGQPNEGRTGLFAPGDLLRILEPRLNELIGNFIAAAVTFLVKATIGLFVLLFIMYYGFKDGRRLVQFAYAALPLREVYKDRLFEESEEVIDAVFVGNILVSIVQWTLGGLGFWAFGLPNPVFWGFVMTILAILPVVGTPIVWLPAGLILIATGDTVRGFGLLIYSALIVSTVDNFLRPKIVGVRSQVHPAIVLIGVVGGLWVFGVVGFLLGPLVLAIFIVVLKIFQQDYLARSELTQPALGRLK
jgi:predicted PurR-regulated permease PerM